MDIIIKALNAVFVVCNIVLTGSIPSTLVNRKRDTAVRSDAPYTSACEEDTPFRFLDLPPEIRNMIYTNLLGHRTRMSLYPQILRISKQINGECSAILQAEKDRRSVGVVMKGLLDVMTPALRLVTVLPNAPRFICSGSTIFASAAAGRDVIMMVQHARLSFNLCHNLSQLQTIGNITMFLQSMMLKHESHEPELETGFGLLQLMSHLSDMLPGLCRLKVILIHCIDRNDHDIQQELDHLRDLISVRLSGRVCVGSEWVGMDYWSVIDFDLRGIRAPRWIPSYDE